MRWHFKPFAIVVVAVVTHISPASAEQVRFTGQTTANEKLISDVVQEITRLGKAQLDCAKPDLIEAMPLPPRFVRAEITTLASPNSVTAEGWTTTFCGTPHIVLVDFWTDGSSTTKFAVELGPKIGE